MLFQLCIILNCLLIFLRFNADAPLSNHGRNMLSNLSKSERYINRCSAQMAHSCQFGYIQLPVFIGRIVAEEDCGNAVGGYLRSTNLLALGLGVRHPRPHTDSYHGKFQLTKYPAIWKKASLIWSDTPSRQFSVMLPTMTSRKRFSRTGSNPF